MISNQRIYLIFFLIGFSSLIGQMVCLREMLVIAYGNEPVIGVFYAAWFAWIAAGAFCGGRIAEWDVNKGRRIFFGALALFAPLLLGELFLFRAFYKFVSVPPQEIIPPLQIFIGLVLILAPFSFLNGFTFPLAVTASKKAGRTQVVFIYAAEAIGILVGGVLFSFVLIRFFDAVTVIVALGLILGLTMTAIADSPNRRKMAYAYIGIFLIVAASPLLQTAGQAARELRWNLMHPEMELLAEKNTPYQLLSVGKIQNLYSLTSDGKIIDVYPNPSGEAGRAALMLCQKPKADKVLIISAGGFELLRQTMSYPVKSIDYLNLDPAAIDLVRRFYPSASSILADSRLTLIAADGRQYLKKNQEKKYDLIIVDLPDPSTAFLNRFFTLEFFSEAKSSLTPDGVFITQASSAENYFGEEVSSYNASIISTLKKVFPRVLVTPGEKQIIIAGEATTKITVNYEELKGRYLAIPLELRSFPADGFYTLLPPERVRFVNEWLNQSINEQDDLINTDLKPISSYLNSLFWAKLSGDKLYSLQKGLAGAGSAPIYLICALLPFLVLTYWINHPHPQAERTVAAVTVTGIAGMAAMAAEIILILSYQSFFGYLYERIAFIAAGFMFGLGVGGLIGRRFIGGRNPLRLGFLLLVDTALLGIIALVLPQLPELSQTKGETVFYLLNFASGLFTGAVFPLALALFPEEQKALSRFSGLLLGADHLGAALGGLLTATVFAPLLGITQAAGIIAVFLAAAALWMLRIEYLSHRDQVEIKPRHSTFRMPLLSWVLIGLAIGSYILGWWLRPTLPQSQTSFSPELLEEVSGFQKFEFQESPFPYYAGYSPNTKQAVEQGIVFSTSSRAGDIEGYGGKINILMALDKRGSIQGLQVVEYNETPSYVSDLDQWLQQIKNKNIMQGITLGEDIDAISGATITSQAVVDIVNKAGKAATVEILQLPATPDETQATYKWGAAIPLILLLILFFPTYYSQNSWWRRGYLLLMVLVFGYYLNIPFTISDWGATAIGVTPPGGHLAWHIQLVAILLLSICFGSVYCGYLCPFGALQELAAWIFPQAEISENLGRRLKFIKYIVLVVALSWFWLWGERAWLQFTPQQYFFAGGFHGTKLLLVIVLLGAGLFYWRFWCLYLCPAGAAFSLFNRFAILRKFSPRRQIRYCPYLIKHPDDLDCLHCNRCRENPPEKEKN